MNVLELKGKTIALAASGGLDSCTATRWLTDHGVRVLCCTADLAQPDEKDMSAISERMIASGAIDHILIDARQQLAEAGLAVIQSQAWYEGRYWNTTGIARYVTVKALIGEMRRRGISILSHGCTGRGNDQVRFQLATNMLAPEFEVYAPWRDEAFIAAFGGREQMIDFCKSKGLPITASKESPYSTDANMLGLTHEAGKLESLATPASFVTPGMGLRPVEAPAEPEKVTIEFKKGRPVGVNNSQHSLLDIFLECNRIAGRHGVGIGTHLVENRFVGIKSRGVYEAPGMELLGSCYGYLIELVLDRRARELFDHLSRYISKQIYQGYWYDLGTQMALNAVSQAAEFVSGAVTVSLHKGCIAYESIEGTPHSLYSEANASMEAIGSYNHADSEGLMRVLGVSARVLAKAGQVNGAR